MKNNIPQGYKATSLGIIPQEWEIKKLEEVGKLFSGLTYSPSDVQADGILVLRSSNIQKGQLVFEDNVFVNTPSYTPVKENDILICVRNGSRNLIGKTAMITKEVEGCAFGAFMSIFRSPINKYIFYLFGTELYRKYIYRNLGATINSINGNDLKRFRFPFPQIVEQQKIVNILSTWDKAIEEQSQLIEKLELRKKGLMQQLLTGKRRLPEFVNSHQECENRNKIDIRHKSLIPQGYKSTTIGIIPKEWKIMSISKAFRIQSGYAFKSNLFTKNGGIPIIRISNLPMNDKYIDLSNCVYYPASINVKEQFIVHKNDFLIAMSGATTGKAAIYNYDYNALLNQRVGAFKQISDKIFSPYLQAIMQSELFISQLKNLLITGAQPNISPSDIENLFFPFPPLAEQKKIAYILTSADHEIELAKQKLELFRQQKHGLMQQLLTGKKRVKF